MLKHHLIEHEQSSAFTGFANQLSHLGLEAEWYVVPSYEGYSALTASQPADVYCLEARLGASPDKPGYSSYAVVQTFLPHYPSVALTLLAELRDTDRQPSSEPAKFSVEVDRNFSTLFLPAAYSAFNATDPTGQNRSVLVQSYHSEMTLPDFVQASLYTLQLVRRYKRDGQLAMIAVDYYDPLTTAIAGVMRFIQSVAGGDIHLVRQTPTRSSLKIPIRNPNGGYHFIDNNSTALDKGFQLAIRYLDNHYQTHGVPIL